MSKVTAPMNATEAITPDQWRVFLPEFTREYRGGHATLVVLGDFGYQVETDDRPFDGISADFKDGENAVWITFGSTTHEHITHGIEHAKAILLRPPTGDFGPALEIEGQDGTKTLLSLSRPEAWALGPAT